VRNSVGTAPAFIVETESCVVISLPGVPNEMEHILHESIIPYLQRKYGLRYLIKVRILHCAGLGEGTIDEKIGDLERLANPTVGLAAHTGIVDVRIAAKAENESRALELIAGVEDEVRRRLGDAVFGADADRLERVVLEAVNRRGWRLLALEAGTAGLLGSYLPGSISVAALPSQGLREAAREARTASGADVALGVAVDEARRSAEMVLIAPATEKTHHIVYGGPPKSLPKWAVNLALNWLRVSLGDLS
jgi:nicotinamide-nucleotide amidase